MEEMEQQKTVAPYELTVWLVRPSVYPMISLNKTETLQDRSSNTEWTDGGSNVSSDGPWSKDREQWVEQA
jgi:hypothetical protein